MRGNRRVCLDSCAKAPYVDSSLCVCVISARTRKHTAHAPAIALAALQASAWTDARQCAHPASNARSQSAHDTHALHSVRTEPMIV
jgi:hypothetical protein